MAREPDAVEQQAKPSELLYLTTDPRETPLVLPPWSRDDPELSQMIDEGHARRRQARRREDRRCSPTPSGYPTMDELRAAYERARDFFASAQPVEPRTLVVNRDLEG